MNAFERAIPRSEWSSWPKRLDRVVPILLDMLASHAARGTFFVLGWVAQHSPAIVRSIVDAGHEVASHGYWHRRIPTMSPEEFRADLRSSKRVIEDVSGTECLGFRAPSFSLVSGHEWAFDALVEEGFRYDSSVFPIRRRGYGNPRAPKGPHVVSRSAGSLTELPLATTSFAGVRLPAAGGGYLRHFPDMIIRRAFDEASAAGYPGTFYVHPWELDPGQPRVPVSLLTRIRHYRGLSRTRESIERLLTEFRFTSIASYLRRGTVSQPTGKVAVI